MSRVTFCNEEKGWWGLIEEESEEEKSDESGYASNSSETEIKKFETAAEIKNWNAKLHALNKNKEALEIRIEAAKKTNDAKYSELTETLITNPASIILSTLILFN